MIEARDLTKRYGDKTAVDDVTHHRSRVGHRVPGPQRRRQVDDHAHDRRP